MVNRMDYSNLMVALGVVAFVIVSVAMILIILIQRPQGGGLSGAFGAGAGSGQTAFGTKTGDVLTIVTVGIFVTFVVLAVILNFATRPPQQRDGETEAGPAAPAAQVETPADPDADPDADPEPDSNADPDGGPNADASPEQTPDGGEAEGEGQTDQAEPAEPTEPAQERDGAG